MIKCYRELISIPTFEERFEYLKLSSRVGESTFGFERYLNQAFYKSREWRRTRRDIFVRDNGCDLAHPEREIFGSFIIHHINPITIEDIELGNPCIFDPENLVSTVDNTHKAIHFGDEGLLITLPPERRKGDTTLWGVAY